MTTIQKLVTTSLRKIGAVPRGSVPTSTELADARDELRRMVDTWKLESLLVYAKGLRTFNLQPAKTIYTYGIGGDFNAERPVSILAATLHLGGGSTAPLLPAVAEDFARIPNRTLSGSPSRFFFNPTFPLAEVRFDRVPDEPAVELVVLEPLSIPDVITTEVSFPPGYEDALLYNLAMRLAGEYDLEPGQEIVGLAISTKAHIKRMNFTVPMLRPDTAHLGRLGTYNIHSGPVQ